MTKQVSQLTFQHLLDEEAAISAANRTTQRHLQSVSDGGQNVYLFNAVSLIPEQGFKFAYGKVTVLEADVGSSAAPFINDAFLTYGEAAEGLASFGPSDVLHLLTHESADWESSFEHGIAGLTPEIGHRSDTNHGFVIASDYDSGTSVPLSYADMNIAHVANSVPNTKCALMITHLDRRQSSTTKLHTYVRMGAIVSTTADLPTGFAVTTIDLNDCGTEWEVITLPMHRKLNTAGLAHIEWNRGKGHSVHPLLKFKVAAGTSPLLVLHGDSRSGDSDNAVTMTCSGCSFSSSASEDNTVAIVTGAIVSVGVLLGLYLCCRFVPGDVSQTRFRPESHPLPFKQGQSGRALASPSHNHPSPPCAPNWIDPTYLHW